MSIDYAELNTSELLAMAGEFNPRVHRGLPRELLIQIIEGADVELPERVINKKRLRIMGYINEHWAAVSYQISCPARSQDPYACFGCSDLQAASCVLANSKKFLND